MAIVVLVLWLFTAGAGFYLLVTSNLGRSRPATTAPVTAPVRASVAGSATASADTSAAQTASVSPVTSATTATTAAKPEPVPAPPLSKREIRRAARDRFDPPSLTAAKNAPVVPGLRSLLEFAHPASALIGLGFWLGYTLVHYRALGWIAFGLLSVTVCLGLTWFAANARAAKRPDGVSRPDAAKRPDAVSCPDAVSRPDAERRHAGEPGPSFSTRLIVVHGGAAAVTFTLAALTALVLGR